jgi:membrane protein
MVSRLRTFVRESAAMRRLWRLLVHLDHHDAPRAANAITFDTFLSAIPLLAIVGYVLHRLNQTGELILAPLLRAAPAPIARLADAEFMRLSEAGAVALAPVSVTGFIWISSAGISTTMGVFDTIFMAKHRPWWHRRLIAIGCVFLALVIAALTAFATVTLAQLAGPVGGPFVAISLPVVVLTAVVAGFFRIAIRRPPHVRRRSLPGAIVTVVLWALVSLLFSTYVRWFAQYTTFYGSLAAVAILLFWLWLLALALVVGGEVNADLEGVRDPGEPGSSLTLSPPPLPVPIPTIPKPAPLPEISDPPGAPGSPSPP